MWGLAQYEIYFTITAILGCIFFPWFMMKFIYSFEVVAKGAWSKSSKGYYTIYGCVLLCVMFSFLWSKSAASAGISNQFVRHWLEMGLGIRTYVYGGYYDTPKDLQINENDFCFVYYIKRYDDSYRRAKEILQKVRFSSGFFHIKDTELELQSGKGVRCSVYSEGIYIGDLIIENRGVVKKLTYYWNAVALEERLYRPNGIRQVEYTLD